MRCASVESSGLVPKEAEVHGLLSLMEFQPSRIAARTKPNGEIIRLLDQNRALWDRLLISRGLAAHERAAVCSHGFLEPPPGVAFRRRVLYVHSPCQR